ncbi:hypothetical protein LUZ60_016430 [Juncus effusus]|nr:hypothetical protein LUZ60_016430 [Juncus effusus]
MMGQKKGLREALAMLCQGGGWSYAVTWRADNREPRLLVMEESFYEDEARGVVEKMINQVHIVGEGIIGGAVLSKKPEWIYYDTFGIGFSCIDNLDIFQGFTWWQHQFLDGIKTIAILPLPWIGAIQFGSIQRVAENMEFSNKAKHMLEKLEFSNKEIISNNHNYTNNIFPTVQIPPTLQSNPFYNPSIAPNPSCQMLSNEFPLPLSNDQNTLDQLSFPQIELPNDHNNLLGASSQFSNFTSDQVQFPDNDLLESMITELNSNSFMQDWWDDQSLIPQDITSSNPNMPSFNPSEPSLEQLLSAIITENGNKTSASASGSHSKPQLSLTSENSNSNSNSNNSNNYKNSGVIMQEGVKGKNARYLSLEDSCSMNNNNNGKKSEEMGEKVIKKRARPGESNRPRPKDRQQIQDRVKELREIVPNGAKCSIDALLDRTIKHMLFLQSVTKYAEKVKQVDEPKMIGEESGVVLKDNSNGGSNGSGGATWAYEVAGQTMVCPIIVEDLSPPGQMLVEMLCEERGFFLEIADIIRGFGLTILKGVMELRERKIWARFLVEANREVTRMDIFLSLVQLLQQTTAVRSSDQLAKIIDKGPQNLKYYQQSQICS